MRICFISDTHTYHDKIELPPCDILCHTGDATYTGRRDELESFGRWFRQLDIPHKIFTGGNHDISLDKNTEEALGWLGFDKKFRDNKGKCYFLHQESIEVEGLKIWGSAFSPTFPVGNTRWGFNVDRGEDIAKKWEEIPLDADIVLTHSTAFGILDWAYYDDLNVGCSDLMARLYQVKALIHGAGHIHESRGVKEPEDMKTLFVNSSICTLQYQPTNDPILVEVFKNDKDEWEYDVLQV